ncbi:MAG TPA: hypothetical protein VMH86_06240 [Rhizomicrobium sp.]|nr:hypothetical protein [Rhizomicrobium sp.]
MMSLNSIRALVTLFVAIMALASCTPTPSLDSGSTDAIQTCIYTFAKKVPNPAPDIAYYKSAGTFCANITYWNFLMRDFDARRAKFQQQNSDDRVLLWMVVAITLSGVVLSGIQLLASYKLAVLTRQTITGDATEVVLEAGRISVRSSVTGLLILTVSFAFFLVFVSSVYQFHEDPVTYPQATPLQGADLGSGGLGAAPSSSPSAVPPKR